ncbi:hypothetical protein BTVI_09719 [Pitangus sulphuratus]|nr:hypothetical protein BTVI_09719 [Pitangus sulphuratus]
MWRMCSERGNGVLGKCVDVILLTDSHSLRVNLKKEAFETDDGSRGSQYPEVEDYDWENDQLPGGELICCSSWIPINLWGLMGFIPESSKSQQIS